MTEKTASVHWEGQGKKGQGKISTETEALKHYCRRRFKSEPPCRFNIEPGLMPTF